AREGGGVGDAVPAVPAKSTVTADRGVLAGPLRSDRVNILAENPALDHRAGGPVVAGVNQPRGDRDDRGAVQQGRPAEEDHPLRGRPDGVDHVETPVAMPARTALAGGRRTPKVRGRLGGGEVRTAASAARRRTRRQRSWP